MNLFNYCQDLELNHSLKQVLDFLQDGQALFGMKFTDQYEIENCHNFYNDLDKKWGSDVVANDPQVFELEQELTESFTKDLTVSEVIEILVRTERL